MNYHLVTETYPPEINGVAMTLEHLTQGLACRGHQVTVIRPRQGEGDRERSHEGVRELPFPGRPLPGYHELRFGYPAFARLRKLWQNPPDLVHIATEGPLGFSAVLTTRKLGIPSITTFHTNFHSYSKYYGGSGLKWFALRYMRWFHNRTQATYAPSEDIRAILDQSGFICTRILSRGVDTRLYNPEHRDPSLRAEWGVASDDCPVVLYAGRVANEKNLPLSIRAFRVLQTRIPEAKMVIVGDGPTRNALQKQHPDIIFAGMQRGAELARHYASADLFFFASITETFGNVVTEAMASGLLVLAYDYAAPARFIAAGQNGFTAPFDEPKAYLAQVEAVLAQRAQWAILRQRARAMALSISWDSVLDGFEKDLFALAQTNITRSP